MSDIEDDDSEDVAPKLESESGQIVSVEAENFMCHKKFSITFGRNLNFITGANGSGKSAVVAAIQLCLGANARTTGRASNLASFIREGSNDPAIIRVTLHNDGSDAYFPHLYGPKIVIERKIPLKGGATYRLISATNKVISTDGKDIAPILKRFNIYVDNPCCLLTQEDSKKFIQGSDKDKYEFFLKATGLQRTKEELEMGKYLLRCIYYLRLLCIFEHMYLCIICILCIVSERIEETSVQCAIGKDKSKIKLEVVEKLQRELDELKALDKYESFIAEFTANNDVQAGGVISGRGGGQQTS